MTDTNRTLTFIVHGLDCPDCAQSLERAVAALPDVAQAALAFAAARLEVTLADGADPTDEIVRLAASMGHTIELVRPAAGVSPAPERPASERRAPWLARHRRDLPTAGAALLMVLGLGGQALGWPTWLVRTLLGASIVAAGWQVARAGWVALRFGHKLDMNALMTIAVVGAMAIGDFAEGAVTMLLFGVGEWLEGYSSDRARRAIRALMALAPEMATRLRQGLSERVPVAALVPGDGVQVRPGERIPADGVILEGASAINQAAITGESVPVEKQPGDRVFAGTVNGAGALQVTVSRLASESTLARILHLVERAQSERAPAQRFVDRFAQVYTPIVIGLALLLAVLPPLLGLAAWRESFYRSLVLLVIACPCALVISTPVTIVSALARAARAGVLIKGGRHIETLARVRALALDKTGTLTEGHLRVTGGACTLHSETDLTCHQCRDVLAKASAVEERSEHLLAQAVVAHAEAQGLRGRYSEGQQVLAFPGRGITGLVDGHRIAVGNVALHESAQPQAATALLEQAELAQQDGYTVLLAEDVCCGQTCYWTVADTVRPEAKAALSALRALGVNELRMLTGDNNTVAERVAREVGLESFRGDLLPEQKLDEIAALQGRHGVVGMVGDGINDAPALARADVGIAVGGAAADAALETADITLMSSGLQRLPWAMRLSQRTMRVLRANIVLALALKLTFLALAAAGIATLWMAVLADTGTALLVTLNGLRLLAARD